MTHDVVAASRSGEHHRALGQPVDFCTGLLQLGDAFLECVSISRPAEQRRAARRPAAPGRLTVPLWARHGECTQGLLAVGCGGAPRSLRTPSSQCQAQRNAWSVGAEAAYWAQRPGAIGALLHVAWDRARRPPVRTARRGDVSLLADRLRTATGRPREVVKRSRRGARLRHALGSQLMRPVDGQRLGSADRPTRAGARCVGRWTVSSPATRPQGPTSSTASATNPTELVTPYLVLPRSILTG